MQRLLGQRRQVAVASLWTTCYTRCRKKMPSLERARMRLQAQGVIRLAIADAVRRFAQ